MLKKIIVFCFLTASSLSAGPSVNPFTKLDADIVSNDGKGSRSVNFVDFNNDGYVDLFISNGKGGGENNMLYLNDGTGSFIQIDTGVIVNDLKPSDGATFGDYNNDGEIDGFVANWYGLDNLLYQNFGDRWYLQSLEPPASDPSHSEAGSWADYDNDGDLDLFVANSDGLLKNFLYNNQGNGRFIRIDSGIVSTEAIPSRAGIWGDYDSDGDLDLYVTNEGSNANSMFENVGGGFIKITTGALVTDVGNSWTASWGDYDNDGDLDLFVGNNSNQLNKLYQNNGDKTFTTITTGAIVSTFRNSASSSWIDYDNDGLLDLLVTNGWGSPTTNQIYQNLGGGAFAELLQTDISLDTGWAYGCAWGDIDNDGDYDLAVARWQNETEDNSLIRNDTGSYNNWIQIKAIGTQSNRSAIGARIKIKATINSQPTWQIREISSQTGYCSQNSLVTGIGLGDATNIDSLVILWPSGETTIMENISTNQRLELIEPGLKINPDKSYGAVPLEVNFDLLSGYEITSYDWTFADGGSSVEANPLHTFTTAGIYEVTLDVVTTSGNYSTNHTIAVLADSLYPQSVNGTGGSDVELLIYANNNLPVKQLEIPLSWNDGMALTLKSISTSGLRTENMISQQLSLDAFNKRMAYQLTAPEGDYLEPGDGPVLRVVFTIPLGIGIDSTRVELLPYNSYEPKTITTHGIFYPELASGQIKRTCCIGMRGNIDNDSEQVVDISDLVYFVDFQFRAGDAPVCFEESDLIVDAIIDIADLVFMVDYQFRNGDAPPDCEG